MKISKKHHKQAHNKKKNFKQCLKPLFFLRTAGQGENRSCRSADSKLPMWRSLNALPWGGLPGNRAITALACAFTQWHYFKHVMRQIKPRYLSTVSLPLIFCRPGKRKRQPPYVLSRTPPPPPSLLQLTSLQLNGTRGELGDSHTTGRIMYIKSSHHWALLLPNILRNTTMKATGKSTSAWPSLHCLPTASKTPNVVTWVLTVTRPFSN